MHYPIKYLHEKGCQLWFGLGLCLTNNDGRSFLKTIAVHF